MAEDGNTSSTMRTVNGDLVEGVEVVLELGTELLESCHWQLIQITCSLEAAKVRRSAQSIQLLTHPSDHRHSLQANTTSSC